jgi:hypothetical protein
VRSIGGPSDSRKSGKGEMFDAGVYVIRIQLNHRAARHIIFERASVALEKRLRAIRGREVIDNNCGVDEIVLALCVRTAVNLPSRRGIVGHHSVGIHQRFHEARRRRSQGESSHM